MKPNSSLITSTPKRRSDRLRTLSKNTIERRSVKKGRRLSKINDVSMDNSALSDISMTAINDNNNGNQNSNNAMTPVLRTSRRISVRRLNQSAKRLDLDASMSDNQ